MAESYQYRSSFFGPKPVAADAVAGEFERLRAAGPLTARGVVEAARPAAAPLHPAFEWDNKKAGDEYRLIQARHLLRSIVVVREVDGVEQAPTSFVVHVPTATGKPGEYVTLASVAGDTDEYGRALAEAQRMLESAQQRFNELRRLTEGRGDKAEAVALASQGFQVVREALAILKAA